MSPNEKRTFEKFEGQDLLDSTIGDDQHMCEFSVIIV
jgi:hypothetical protein